MTEYRVPVVSLQVVRERTIILPVSKASSLVEASMALHAVLDNSPVERMAVLMLSARNRIMAIDIVSKGGMHASAMTCPDIFRAALVHGASRIILGHNHPSGDATPSEQDLTFTSEVRQAASLLGIPILDHIITAQTDNGEPIETSLLEQGAFDR